MTQQLMEVKLQEKSHGKYLFTSADINIPVTAADPKFYRELKLVKTGYEILQCWYQPVEPMNEFPRYGRIEVVPSTLHPNAVVVTAQKQQNTQEDGNLLIRIYAVSASV